MEIRNPFRSVLRGRDFNSTADVSVTAAVATEYGRYAVPTGQAVALGYGDLMGQDNAQGRMYAQIVDDTAGDATEEQGVLRLDIQSPTDRHVVTVWEARTEQTDTSATDRRQQLPFPEIPEVAGEDYDVVLFFISDATDIIQWDFSTIFFDITRFDLIRGG